MEPFKKIVNKHIGELLIERGIIDRKQLDEAISFQKKGGGLFGEVLIKLNYATEEDIAHALTCQYGFPYLPLSNYEIAPDVLDALPENLCRQFCLIAIDKIGKSLTLAMANPLNIKAIEDIELITGCTVQAFVSTSTDIKKSIDKYYNPK